MYILPSRLVRKQMNKFAGGVPLLILLEERACGGFLAKLRGNSLQMQSEV
jgi:hypothetical protein